MCDFLGQCSNARAHLIIGVKLVTISYHTLCTKLLKAIYFIYIQLDGVEAVLSDTSEEKSTKVNYLV